MGSTVDSVHDQASQFGRTKRLQQILVGALLRSFVDGVSITPPSQHDHGCICEIWATPHEVEHIPPRHVRQPNVKNHHIGRFSLKHLTCFETIGDRHYINLNLFENNLDQPSYDVAVIDHKNLFHPRLPLVDSQ